MLTFQVWRCFGGPYYVLRTTHIVTLHHHTLIPPCLCFCFLRFETSSHVFRSFAIVPPHASKLLRMSFAVPLLSLLCFFFLRFETSKVRILDLLCFERVYSLFSASFLFASKLIRMYFAVSLLSPRTLPNYFPVPFVPPSSLVPFAPLASPLAPPPPSHSLAHAREGYSLADPPSLLGSSRLVKNGDGHNLSLIRHDNSASSS